jgi:cytochrome P450
MVPLLYVTAISYKRGPNSPIADCFDIVAKLTIGKALGFLNGNDVSGLVKTVKTYGFYLELITQMPSLHKYLLGNPLFSGSRESPFLTVVKSSIQDRLRDPDPQGQPRPDLLSHFVATHEEYPQLMDNKFLAISTSSNLVAGGLSPGKAFDCVCHYLATNPELQDKLYAELQEAHISLPVSYDQAKALPYLEGTIREAYRFIDPANANLQRVTGAGGLELPDGCRLPPNTNVGCPTSFIAQEPRAFGSDAHHFKPERWMQGENETHEVYLERRKLMNKSDLTFGHGSRSCVGKNIAELELYKAVATLIAQFTVSAFQL